MKKILCMPKRSFAKMVSLASLLFLSAPGSAQNLNKHFMNVTNWGIDYIPTNDYILSGSTMPPTINGWSNIGAYGGPNQRIQLEKIDNTLSSYWFKTYVTQDEQNAVITGQCTHLDVWFDCRYAKHTADGGYIICGCVRRDAETSGCPGPAYDNIFLLKTNSAGNVMWYKRYDQTGLLNSVTETSSGKFIACGYIGAGYSPSASLIIGTDAGGNLLWSKTSITPTPWDSTTTILSSYQQVIPFQGKYALIGGVNDAMYTSMLVTVIDDAGTFYQNAVVNDYYFGENTLYGISLVDVGDGDLGITGIGGQPCPGVAGYTNDQIMVSKLEPYSMTIKFLKYYYNTSAYSCIQGNGITSVHGNKLCVTGYASHTGAYLETNFSGAVSRYTELSTPDAEMGMSMTHNTLSDIPIFSGQVGGTANTFVIRDDQNYDCTPDIPIGAYSINYLIEHATNVDAGVHQINDIAIAYDLPRIEMIDCGGTPPPPPPPTISQHSTGVNSITNTALVEVAPNPADNEINITIDRKNYSGGMLNILDVTGRTAISQELSAGSNSANINVSTLKPGTYLLSLNSKDGSCYTTKFLKK